MVINEFLYRLYFKVPATLRGTIIRKILKNEGGKMYSPTYRAIYKKKFKIDVGYGSYGGCFNTNNHLPPNITIGNYCSIAQNIRIFRANHPKQTFTSHPIMYNPVAGYVRKDALDRPALTIGHDVWIGEWVIILPGVLSIGNGAIIGAGSIVTKDVEPYTIVAGNPAKKLSVRFNDEIIAALEKTEWWELDKNQLLTRIDELTELVKGKFRSHE